VWQREWQAKLLANAQRRVRAKVSSQQLLIFRMADDENLSFSQVAKKLGVSLAQIYLARHRVGRLLKAEIELLRAGIHHRQRRRFTDWWCQRRRGRNEMQTSRRW